MAFESIAEYIPEIEARLAERQSPLKIARDLGLSKSIVYDYKNKRFDIKGAAAVEWYEEQQKGHEQRLAEGKVEIIDSLELLNKAKARALYLIDLEIGSRYKLADGAEKELSLASAAVYWQMGQKMACEAMRQELELTGDDSESRKADAMESWTNTRLAILKAVDDDPEAKAAICDALEQRRRSTVRSGPVIWAKEVLGFHPDPWQRDLLKSRANKIILNCNRQSGKSTTTAALGLHECIYRKPTVGLCVAPGIRQSGELMQKFDEFRGAVELPSNYLDEDTKLSVKFYNKNRFLALPGSEKTIRGISAVTLLLEDEASRVLDELYKSVRPMLAVSHGRHVLMSTPFGKRGHFWEVWEKRRKGVAKKGTWEWYLVSADDCPRISKEFLDEEKEELGDLFFLQEYYNQFIDEETQLFTHESIMKALSNDVAIIEI